MNKVEVVYSEVREKWLVLGNNFEESSHRLKQAAEREGRRKAKRNRPSQFIVERRDGDISYTQRYTS